MAANFGVQLKPKDGGGSAEQRPGGIKRTDLTKKPVSDLKAMFDKGKDDTQSKAFSEPGTNFVKKTTTTTTRKTAFGANTVTKSEKTDKDSQILSHRKNLRTVETKPSQNSSLSAEDKKAFEALHVKLKKTGISADRLSLDDDTEIKPAMAIAKTYSGGQTYKASIETKNVKTVGDDGDKKEITKTDAASFLSFSLLKLRTRPGSLKGDENLSRSNSIDEDSRKRTSSPPTTGSPRSHSPNPISQISKQFPKETKYVPGVARGWKASADEQAGVTSSPISQGGTKFSDSSVGKIRNEFSPGTDKRVPGFRSVSPVNLNRNSSDDSSSSSNLSPRGYRPRNNSSNLDDISKTIDSASKTDINKNIEKFEANKSSPSVFKTKTDNANKSTNVEASSVVKKGKDSELKLKLSAVKQLSLDKDKIRSNRNSGSMSSDSEKGKRSPKVKEDSKWMEKSRTTLEDFKQQQKLKGQGHRPLSRASSSGSNSSLSRGEDSGIKSHVDRFTSPEPKQETRVKTEKSSGNKSLGENQLRDRNLAISKKLTAGKFQDLKKGFETKGMDKRSQSPPNERKPKIEIKSNKPLLERKQSFEGIEILRKKSYERKEVISPRDRGSVLETIKSLNELDAKAKATPNIIRRTQSLPVSEILDDNDDSSVECLYEIIDHDVVGLKPTDDEANEGDISSEADIIYEEIPGAQTGGNKEIGKRDLKERRATAFRKRKKTTEEQSTEIQAGTDGDIDSDSDSSNSGIYDFVGEGVKALSESDSIDRDLPPELPPLRNLEKKKKKKNKDEKGTATKVIKEQFTRLGDKLKKNLKKTKSSQPDSNLEAQVTMEDNPVCDSEGTDGDPDIDQGSKRSSLERSDDGSLNNEMRGNPPPLPPRYSGMHRELSGGDISRLSAGDSDNYQNQVSPASKDRIYNKLDTPTKEKNTNRQSATAVSENKSGRSSPPLPPRNRVSNNLDLNLVVPIAPGGGPKSADARKSGLGPRDGYLPMQKVSSPEIPYMDASPQATPSPSDAPPLPNRPAPKRAVTADSLYVDVGDAPPLPSRPNKPSSSSTSSYVEVDEAPIPESDYSLAEEIRKELEKRPVSSAYIRPMDLTTVPDPKSIAPPFEDVLRFKSGLEDEILYMDLSDDQVYGTVGQRYKSKLESESLYQVYNTDKITRASKRNAVYNRSSTSLDESDEDAYSEDGKERVYEDLSEYSSGRGSLDLDKSSEGDNMSQTSKLSTLEMFGKKGTILRALWSDMPEVKGSGVLDTLKPNERKLQESIFEIITSEATYLKSLNVLINVYLMSEEMGSDMSNKCVMTRQERHVVFSNIGTIRDTSERFLSDLESHWQKNVMLSDICDIIAKHASQYFECYVHYCSNQTFQDRAVTLLRKKPEFTEALKRLESHTDCQGLPMISFLLLPMQRVTRLPLLVDAICHRMDPFKDKERHKSAINACNALSKVVRKCNDGAKKMQQTEQMCHIAQQIEFSTTKEIKQISLISSSRFLVKQGEVTRITSEAGSRLPFGKAKPGKQAIQLFLFNDILLVTKKKGAQYVVNDYAQRNSLHVEVLDNPEKNTKLLPLGAGGCKNLFLIVMLENHEKKQVESVFACNSMSDRARWVDAVTPVKIADDQRIYEDWDCPQVQCVKKYLATEPDELGLEESDVVNVYKKLDDGMYEGERLRDGERGWFPKEHTVEIVNSHVRARNLRMKYRLLAAVDGCS